ncbi:hypothetical protein BVRB_4g081780 [Beta vulgaris subsp. vulgaris]|nr:hypothetical protein BVRB_4g081780 [Beta vulgaris subsp. vulgaris]
MHAHVTCMFTSHKPQFSFHTIASFPKYHIKTKSQHAVGDNFPRGGFVDHRKLPLMAYK